jgi:hypothetical protein
MKNFFLADHGYSLITCNDIKEPIKEGFYTDSKTGELKPNRAWTENKTKALSSPQIIKRAKEVEGVKYLGLVCGFNNVEVIDVDLKHFHTEQEKIDFWTELLQELEGAILNFKEKVLIVSTTSGGKHIIYRNEKREYCSGNKELARRKEAVSKKTGNPLVIVETRGEGGYACIYELEGNDYTKLIDLEPISKDDKNTIFGVAISLDNTERVAVKKEYNLEVKNNPEYENGVKPWDDYNTRTGAADRTWSLISNHFTAVGETANKIKVLRHDSNAGHSGYIYKDTGILKLYSDNSFLSGAGIDTTAKGLRPFEVYLLANNIDAKEAAKRLTAEGYGSAGTKIKNVADVGFLQDDSKYITPDYRARYDFFINEYIKYDTPIPNELKEEFTHLQQMVKPDKKEDRTAWLLEEIHRRKIDFTKTIPPPPQAWTLDDTTLGRFGDFGLVIGKAKSKKSFFINIAIATAISDDHIQGRFKSHLPEDRKKVVYFDTEQQNYDVDIACNRIALQLNLNGKKELNDNLLVVPLRGDSPALKIELIEAYLYNTPELSFVVIDGIRDLITSINDEEQASMIATKLLKWSKELNIYILVVLHVNKGDNNARGHVGTELVNKAESVLSISVDSKDPEISVMEPVHCRGKAPKSFAFRINERGLPEEVTDYVFTGKSTFEKSKIDVEFLNDEALLKELALNVLKPSKDKGLKYDEFWNLIKNIGPSVVKQNFTDKTAKETFKKIKDLGIVTQLKQNGPWRYNNDFELF